MTIEKNGRTYSVAEHETKWILKTEEGGVTLKYDISKKDCGSAEELKEYVASSDAI